MRTVQMEYLRPDEIVAEREHCSIVYLPIGPLEWHGPAMPLGTDPLMAQELARAAAQKTGGVVMPTLFIGTERERPADILKTKGFENPEDLYVIGMDVPKVTMKSLFAKEDVFGMMVRAHLEILVKQGYQLIVIVNGHGALGQKATLERLAIEFSHETPSRVVVEMPVIDTEDEHFDYGHGCLVETSYIRYLFGEHVDLTQLPPRDVKLPYTDYGIADDFVFSCQPSPDNCVVHDPRDATPELGRKFFANALEHLCGTVEAAYAAATNTP